MNVLLRLLVITWCVANPVSAHIRVVLTAALTDAHSEFRKKQYIESFSILNSYGYGPKNIYVVEALKKQGPTFLQDYSSHVFYATVNNPNFKNHGINEAATLLEGINYFGFDDEDMIVKFTGRHQLTTDYLLRFVEEHSEYDAIVKVNSDGNVYTLGFAMRCKYIKEMFSLMDFEAMGYVMRPIEYDVGDYIKWKVKQGNFRVFYVDKLHMKANIFGSSTAPGVKEQIKYY